MKFEPIQTICAASGVTVPAFPFLAPDENFYECLLIQPKGTISASPSGIVDASLHDRLYAFLRDAQRENVDLAVCPEYCCPWSALQDALTQGVLPATGRLWALGMQSLDLGQLSTFKSSNATVKILHEPEALAGKTSGFLDAVAYLFRDASNALVILFQFKQAHMSVHPALERDALIHGTRAYYFENNGSSIRLATLVCSDALAFDPNADLPDFPGRSYLLLHPQLNPGPRHSGFSDYRRTVFGRNTSEVEIITLNWAEGTTVSVPGGSQLNFEFPHSALYSKSRQLDIRDTALQTNHDHGAFYFYWEQPHAHVFVAHDEEHCLRFRSTKPSQVEGPPPSSVRSGLQASETRSWNGTGWHKSQLQDGCFDALKRAHLHQAHPFPSLQPLDVDRFVALCCGSVKGKDWHKPNKLGLCKLGAQESLHRIGFCRCGDSRREAASRLSKVFQLVDIFSASNPKPGSYSSLLAGSGLHSDPQHPCCNIYCNNEAVGTGAYVGDDVGGVLAAEARDWLRTIFPIPGNWPIFVWYTEGPNRKHLSTENETSITEAAPSGPSITE